MRFSKLFHLGMVLFPSIALASQPLTFEGVVGLIEKHGIQSIPELLPRLPRDYRSHYTLMYRSRSLQAASYLNPRAIVFGADAKLILAFNGHPSQKGYDRLEIIQFRDETKSFEFREITFGSKVHVSPPNPPVCKQCHRDDLRPNWEPYPNWSGAYGSNDDRFSHYDRRDQEELSELRGFLKSAGSHPRYRHLVDLKAGYTQPSGDGDAYGLPSFRVRYAHNSVFTHRLALLNSQRIAREIMANPTYAAYKYALLGMIACDPGRDDFFSEGFPGLRPGDLNHDTYADRIPNRLKSFYSALSIPIQDWFLSFDPEIAQLTTPISDGHQLGVSLVEADPSLGAEFPILSRIVEIPYSLMEGDLPASRIKDRYIAVFRPYDGRAAEYESICGKLAEASRKSLLAAAAPPIPSIPHQVPAIERCIRCHETGVAPRIPFSKPREISPRLIDKIRYRISDEAREKGVGMPPQGPLREDERRSLLRAVGG